MDFDTVLMDVASGEASFASVALMLLTEIIAPLAVGVCLVLIRLAFRRFARRMHDGFRSVATGFGLLVLAVLGIGLLHLFVAELASDPSPVLDWPFSITSAVLLVAATVLIRRGLARVSKDADRSDS